MDGARTKRQRAVRFVLSAVTRAREQHKANLIAAVMKAVHTDAKCAQWLLERQFPHEFAPYDRRPIPVEPPAEKKINVAFVVDTKGKSLEEVATFPVLTPEEVAQTAPEPQRELTLGKLFDGNISKLGRFVGDLPFDGNET